MKFPKYLYSKNYRNQVRTDFSSEIINRFHENDVNMENIYRDNSSTDNR